MISGTLKCNKRFTHTYFQAQYIKKISLKFLFLMLSKKNPRTIDSRHKATATFERCLENTKLGLQCSTNNRMKKMKKKKDIYSISK